jgi:putative addiction module component (TIGR02574 family)
MAMADDLLSDALRLPTQERARLARELLLSLEEEQQTAPAEVEAAWAQELQQRTQDILDGKVTLGSREELERELAESIERVRRQR